MTAECGRLSVVFPAVVILTGIAGIAALGAPAAGAAAAVAAADGAVTVRAEPVTAQYAAYARVRPFSMVAIRAGEPGTVTDLRVEPGSAVTADEPLASLSGPEVQALLTARRGAVGSAQTRLMAARRALEAERRKLAGRLSTIQSVAAAQSSLSAAGAALQEARARLLAAQRMVTLRAPASGTVVAVTAGTGERVGVGQTVITLQTSGSLWLQATYYGREAAAIHVGMRGRFQPASGGSSISVKVASVFAALGADGGERVGLLPTAPQPAQRLNGAAPWLNGEFGTVTLAGPVRRMIAIPTSALVMDQARWWVLLRTPGGDRRQAVVPGPARGWETFIEKGLEPGQRVVVEDAFLEFHRGISRHYTPPD